MVIDWQTVVVTLVALGAVLVIVRRFVPAGRRPTKDAAAPVAACDHCEPATPARPSRTAPTPVVSVGDLRASARRAKH